MNVDGGVTVIAGAFVGNFVVILPIGRQLAPTIGALTRRPATVFAVAFSATVTLTHFTSLAVTDATRLATAAAMSNIHSAFALVALVSFRIVERGGHGDVPCGSYG